MVIIISLLSSFLLPRLPVFYFSCTQLNDYRLLRPLQLFCIHTDYISPSYLSNRVTQPRKVTRVKDTIGFTICCGNKITNSHLSLLQPSVFDFSWIVLLDSSLPLFTSSSFPFPPDGCVSTSLLPCRVSAVPAVRSTDRDQRSGHRQPVLQLHHLLHGAGHRQRDCGGLRCSRAPDLLVRCANSDHQESFHQRYWSRDCGLCW